MNKGKAREMSDIIKQTIVDQANAKRVLRKKSTMLVSPPKKAEVLYEAPV